MFDATREDLQIGIVGTGLMGRGIAQIAAMAGITVYLFDAREGAAEEARAAVETTFIMLSGKGRIDADAAAATPRSDWAWVLSVDGRSVARHP